ncbi:hypothetical protein EMIHUDRAFT_457606, partial [Emiliania huxleyi CCMP1516]|uniref:EamA domain-containing protein n=2 Tax=Emiliania huxleyi TaxID=2903 RepID=A0A0D3JP44_EMIH1
MALTVSLALLAKALGATPRREGRGYSVRTGLLARARSRGFASPSASVEADASLSVRNFGLNDFENAKKERPAGGPCRLHSTSTSWQSCAYEIDGSGGAIGIALCLLSVLLLAIGITIQKYALTFIEPHVLLGDCCGTQSIRGPLARVPRTHAIWLAGLTVYFGGNGVFVLALAFTPASLAAALMATIVVANAALSRCVLHEELRRCDYHGGALILGGIAVTGWYAPAEVVSYDAPALARLLSPTSNPFGFGYLLVLVLSVTALAVLVVRHEAAHRADIQPLRAATPAAADAFGEGGACSCRGEPAACSPSTLESGRCPAATAIALSATPASAPAATALSAAAPSASAPSAAAIAAAAAAVPRPSSAAAAAAASPAS